MIKIIDYRAGNAPSVMHAVRHIGYNAQFAREPDDLIGATHIILPGVGSAKATMESLKDMDIIGALTTSVLKNNILFLGICVGLQVLFEHSDEEDTNCLGWLKGRVVKFDASKVRVPQMGWNHVNFVKNVLPCRQADCFYFVNSYHARLDDPSDLWGTADYNGPFTAAVCRNNIFGTQFHAEKSGAAGLSLLKEFFELKNGGLR